MDEENDICRYYKTERCICVLEDSCWIYKGLDFFKIRNKNYYYMHPNMEAFLFQQQIAFLLSWYNYFGWNFSRSAKWALTTKILQYN